MGLDTMLDNDLIGDLLDSSSASSSSCCTVGWVVVVDVSVRILWRAGDDDSSASSKEHARFCDVDGCCGGSARLKMVVDCCWLCCCCCFCWEFATLCLSEFCCDGDNVESCSCMSIIWSPRRTLRLSGDLPLKKSFTWLSLSDSSACITVFSARWAW